MPDWQPVRAAGRGALPDGGSAVWVVSEGRRGRRWREVVRSAGPAEPRGRHGIVSSLLLETGPDGRFLHLELSTPAGLLTLHPEGDGTLHGNAVTDAGVAHVVALPFPEGAFVLVADSPLAAAAAIRSMDAPLGIGDASVVPAAIVDVALGARIARVTVRRVATDIWDVDRVPALRLDGDGLPVLEHAARWPLELPSADSFVD